MSGFKITVLGCSGTYAEAGGACSGYLVDSQDTLVWLDAGPGTLSNLQLHTQLEKVDALVLTHEHADHWLEMPVVYNALKYFVKRERMPVYGTKKTKEMAEQFLECSLSPIFDFNVVSDGDQIQIGNQNWRFSQTDHPVETMGIKASTNGTSFAFSADTGPNWNPIQVSSDVDLFLCEATHLAEDECKNAVHLSARQAGEMARQTNAKRLIITHRAPECSAEEQMREASEAFGESVELAEVNAVYNLA